MYEVRVGVTVGSLYLPESRQVLREPVGTGLLPIDGVPGSAKLDCVLQGRCAVYERTESLADL